MTATFDQAKDQIFKLFYDAWKANTTAIVGYVPEVRWVGVEKPERPDASKYWVRVSKQVVGEEQTTLSDGVTKRFTAYGIVFVQLFCPKSEAKETKHGEKLAVVARNAFRGKTTPGKVVFRNARINDGLAPEEQYYRFNIVAEFEYDDLG